MWHDCQRARNTDSAALLIAMIVVLARAVPAIGHPAIAADITLYCDSVVQG